MFFHMTSYRGRHFDVSPGVFKFHQPQPSSNVSKRYRCAIVPAFGPQQLTTIVTLNLFEPWPDSNRESDYGPALARTWYLHLIAILRDGSARQLDSVLCQ